MNKPTIGAPRAQSGPGTELLEGRSYAPPRRRSLGSWQDQKAELDRQIPRPPRAASVHPRTTAAPKRGSLGLQAKAGPLDQSGARHLLRRTGFGAAPAAIQSLIGADAAAAAQSIVDAALMAPRLPAPPWATTLPPHPNASEAAFSEYFDLNETWFFELAAQIVTSQLDGGLQERLTLFWHNHFVTSFDSYFLSSFGFGYWALLEQHSLGNFRDFVRAVGLDATMLYYLDGYLNEKNAPNENYARELLELFTMGPRDSSGAANYTEDDIVQIARALTGWSVDWHRLDTHFVPFLHDQEAKSFFGRTGNFDYDDVIDVIFETRAREIAEFVCGKLYREFVYETPNDQIVSELADTFIAADFEIAPVLRQLLASEHFNDADLIGSQVKSPIQTMTAFASEVGIARDPELLEALFWGSAELGQWLLFPPNVAGWPGHRDWVDTSTLPRRWDYAGYLAYHGMEAGDDAIRAYADALHDRFDLAAPFKLAVAMARHLLPIPLEDIQISDGGESLSGNLIGNPLPGDTASWPEHELDLVRRFLDGVPWYEWSLDRQEAPPVIRQFMGYLVQVPEFQLT